MSGLQAPRGTFDVLPDQAAAYSRVELVAAEVLGRAGYGRIATPAFEPTELFARGVGESTDIVMKEMYSFDDGGGRSVTLRPEGTAPICRAYVEHGMHKRQQPVRLWYSGPFFRHEAPQAGRYRQFHQIGAEAFGSDLPELDAEIILLLAEILERLGVEGTRLRLGTLGSGEGRLRHRELLVDYLRSNESRLPTEVRERIDVNPLRAFDSSDQGTVELMKGAPLLIDSLDNEDVEHFEEVCRLLESAGLGYERDPRLVRGLDYYTRTVFEFTSDRLGAQSGVGGGGRYDRLVELIGGQPTPAIGWAAGVERILLASGDQVESEDGCDLLVVAVDRDGIAAGQALALAARSKGLSARLEAAGRSIKASMKHADRIGAASVALIETDGVSLKNMKTGDQNLHPDTDTVVAELIEGRG
ncbi:MAG: histidine--tRNA ligase [Actinomycetes bacterium]